MAVAPASMVPSQAPGEFWRPHSMDYADGDDFIATFVAYNGAVWPAQIVAYGVGIGMVAAALRPSAGSGRLIAAGLALMWVWTGVVCQGLFFARINQAALGFGALFVLQGVLLAYLGVVRGRLGFAAARRCRTGCW